MLLRAYPILGTLILALSFASPAYAKGKKKSVDSAQSDDASANKADKKAQSGAKKAKKKGKKADDEAVEEKKEEPAADTSSTTTTDTAASSEAGATPDPNVWEKPPEEAEKPKARVDAPPPEEKVGDGRPWSAGIAAGWAFKTDRRGLPADPYGLAAGLRGGYSALLNNHLYLGLYFNWYLGGSQTGAMQRTAVAATTSHANYWQFGAEVGYDWWIASVIIRPSMQIGEAIAVNDALGTTRATGDFMFGPGMTVVYPWDNLFVAGEMRGNVVTGDGLSALLFAAQLGMRFEP